MSVVHNERTKLLATALDNIAVAVIVTAQIAPAVGFLHLRQRLAAVAPHRLTPDRKGRA